MRRVPTLVGPYFWLYGELNNNQKKAFLVFFVPQLPQQESTNNKVCPLGLCKAVVAKYFKLLEKKATQWSSFVIPFNVSYILKHDFRISGSQDLWLNWQVIGSVEFSILFLDTEPKFALAKRGKTCNYGKKCNNKSTVTTFFPPHIFSGIYLNIQLMKTRRGCNFNSNGNSVSIQSHLN